MRQLLVGLMVSLSCVELIAQEYECLCEANSLLYFGGSYTRSHIDPSGLSDYDGDMAGVQGMYQYRPICDVYLAIGGFWRAGPNCGSVGARDLLDAGVHERIGYTFCLCDGEILLTPYTGFGYRHLSHHVKPNNGSEIKLRYNEFFFPVGLLSTFDLCDCFVIGLDVMWMGQVFPTVTFNVADGARWVIKSTYANFNVGLPLYYNTCSSSWSGMLKPFFEFWQDGQTVGKTQFDDPLGLPKNSYLFWGIEFNLQYVF